MMNSKVPITIIVASGVEHHFDEISAILRRYDAKYEYELIFLRKNLQKQSIDEFLTMNHDYLCGMINFNDQYDLPKTLLTALESSNGDYVLFNTGDLQILENQIEAIGTLDQHEHGRVWAKKDGLKIRLLHPIRTSTRFAIKLNEKVDLLGSYIYDFLVDRLIAQEISQMTVNSFWPNFYRLAYEKKITFVPTKYQSWISYEQLEFHYALTLSNFNQLFMKRMNRVLSIGLLYVLANTLSVAFLENDVWGRKQVDVPGWATLTILVTVLFIVMNYSISVVIALIQNGSNANNDNKLTNQRYIRFTRD